MILAGEIANNFALQLMISSVTAIDDSSNNQVGSDGIFLTDKFVLTVYASTIHRKQQYCQQRL